MKLRKKAKKRLKDLLLITVILIIFIVSYKTLHKEKDKPSSKICETLRCATAPTIPHIIQSYI